MPVTVRSVVLGLALIPFNAWFNLYGYIWGESRPATVSLIFNVVLSVLLVTLVTRALGRGAVLDATLAGLPRGNGPLEVLEVGAGHGFFTKQLRDNGAHVTITEMRRPSAACDQAVRAASGSGS